MEKLDLSELKELMGDEARDLPQFAHFSWCTTQIEEKCKISPSEVEMIYDGLVVPGEKTPESYLKFFYCLVEYVRSTNPYEEWIKVEGGGENWMGYIIGASEYAARFEEDQEKWISEFKTKMIGNPDSEDSEDSDIPFEI